MKKYMISILGLFISTFCFISYNKIGAYLTNDGRLVEPFYFIGIGSIIGVISVFILLITITKSIIKKN